MLSVINDVVYAMPGTVLIKEEWRKSTCRQSIVMFVDPDPEVVFKPLAGPCDKYPPVNAGEYLTMRRNQTYK